MKDTNDIYRVVSEMENDLDDIKQLLEKLLRAVEGMGQQQMP
jgi:hypothetical protein